MPTSDPSWSSNQPVPCLNSYKIKRKPENDHNTKNAELSSKRLCTRPSDAFLPVSSVDEAMELEKNYNVPMTVDHPLVNDYYSIFSQKNDSTHESDSFQVLPHFGNSDNTKTLSEEQETIERDFTKACSNMDTDFVPNPSQYTSSKENCTVECGVGDKSANTGRVRCYCKPSWDGMDLRPYISDIY